MSWLDTWVGGCLQVLAVWLLLSGLDDLLVDLVWLGDLLRRRLTRPRDSPQPKQTTLAGVQPKLIAIFVPLWHEHRVIGKMLERNLNACRYPRFEVFAGCYPNDELTISAVNEVRARHSNVHLVVCPRDGPTSKADCLNAIYQGMLQYEQQRAVHFDLIVIHDAEDWIDPRALDWINYYAQHYDMVQVPVLPLPTPLKEFTHGVYCDEFAEFHTKDLPVRLLMGAGLPSSGVGTGFSRKALERLAAAQEGRIFDADALTEDYAAGLRLKQLGCKQWFIGLAFSGGAPMATREYFPRRFKAALRQRTRWVTGIALQGWQQFGWRGNLAQIYFYWRDRKGLLGNPLTLLVNALFFYGVASWVEARLSGRPWGLARVVSGSWLLQVTLGFQLWRMAVRSVLVGRVYGFWFACLCPLRIIWANGLNATASVTAVVRYLRARWARRPLAWHKTEHRYPQRAALAEPRPRLGELLVRWGWLDEGQLARALASKPQNLRLGEYLVQTGQLSEWQVYRALSAQQELPLERLRPEQIPPAVARSLPRAVVRRWKVLPFKVAYGNLFVATPELPSDKVENELRQFTRLEIRFHLVPPSQFEQLERALIEAPADVHDA